MLHKAQEGRKTFQWNVFRREPSQGVPCKTNAANKRKLSGGLCPPLYFLALLILVLKGGLCPPLEGKRC